QCLLVTTKRNNQPSELRLGDAEKPRGSLEQGKRAHLSKRQSQTVKRERPQHAAGRRRPQRHVERPVSFGDGDAHRHQERSGWQDRYKAVEESEREQTKDPQSGDPRNHSSKRVHSLTRSLPRGAKRLRLSATL